MNKIDVIREHKDDFVAALNAYLDRMYGMTETYLEENGDVKDFLSADEKLENFVKELKEDEEKYEKVRRKILDNDFELSPTEIQLAGLAMAYCIIRFDKHIEEVQIAKQNAIEIYNQIKEIDIPLSKDINS